ncbi:MAG: nitroreductase family protein [candidate division Zixibacteria bacterium]|nr:nitroreductase family protein [candidate division Zixibacteria bacterium]MDH3938715.1 nitroreductase family protein [candidate division Zixibacteria bacterium]MDH4033841.1 nitroreductase family protein [candidate division Zixibacteria bacterium]
MKKYPFVPLSEYIEYPEDEMLSRSQEFYENVKRRRTVRQFSGRAVPREIIENSVRAAGTAPSGANMQPWHFVIVSTPEMKKEIREAAEIVEKDFYTRRAPQSWLDALAPLGTDDDKSYIEDAPYLIVVFSVRHTFDKEGNKVRNYYQTPSVGIATGILITALHNAGLATLTHTPSPMAFLRDLLGRPETETPFLMVVAGYPKDGATVPDIGKKPLDDIATFV